MQQWIIDELECLDLGDQRLHNRTACVLEALAARPQSSLCASLGGWSEMVGAYRLLNNPRVESAPLLEPHRQRTLERMALHEVVLCVEDTTFLSFGGARTGAGLGPHTSGHEQGFSAHVMLALAAREEMVLGVLGSRHWVKDAALAAKQSRKKRPIQEKESYRWVEGMRQVHALAKEQGTKDGPGPRLVYVADRESDIYEVLEAAAEGPGHFVIRASHDRRDLEGRSISQALAGSELLGLRRLRIPARAGEPVRQATLEVRACALQLPPPTRQRKAGTPPPTLPLFAIEAREMTPPKGVAPIHWVLLSDLPCEDLEAALEKLQWYARRWMIERFFKVLKSGCRVEAMQLQSFASLEAATSLYLLVAWRVLYLLTLGRQCPQLPAEALFSREEWQAAWRVHHRCAPPPKSPSLGEIIEIVARFGGYPARKNDPPPGAQALWSGLIRIQDFALAFQSTNP